MARLAIAQKGQSQEPFESSDATASETALE